MNLKTKTKLLVDEYMRLAKVAETEGFRRECGVEYMLEHQEKARIYLQMVKQHMEFLIAAEMARPERFSGKNTGTQNKTRARKDYLNGLAKQGDKHEVIAACAMNDQEAMRLWGKSGEDLRKAVLNFLKRNRMSF